MYLRETHRRNADGSVVGYLVQTHNERDPRTGTPKAKVIHNFGRADQVDRQALARLVRSISRYLDPAEATAAAVPGQVDILDARPMGTAYAADRLWARLGVGAAIARVAAGRRVDPALVERVIFAMVANRLSPTPLSKLAGAAWVTNRVFIPGLPELSDDACYRAMDFLLDALPTLQEEVFFAVANLLNLEVDLLFFDGSSTCWETDSADAELLDAEEEATVAQADTGEDLQQELPLEAATRRYGRGKDHRRDLPQVVIGLAVTREAGGSGPCALGQDVGRHAAAAQPPGQLPERRGQGLQGRRGEGPPPGGTQPRLDRGLVGHGQSGELAVAERGEPGQHPRFGGVLVAHGAFLRDQRRDRVAHGDVRGH